MIPALAFALLFQDGPDPLLMSDLGGGRITVSEGLWRSNSGARATLDDVVKASEGKRFVFVGESHDQAAHHQFQADVIQELVESGRNVVVGFEMFTRDNQSNLAPWTMGKWSEESFLQEANWKTQWGFDFALYRPIFQTIKRHRLPMVALNLPRDWVRQIGRQGASSVTPEQRRWLPNLDLGDQKHRAVFSAMTGGHPMSSEQAENMYAAMVAWDEGMANTAMESMAGRLDRNAVMVVIAGSGHMMYGLGINGRIRQRAGLESVGVLCTTSDEPRQISDQLADFVLVTRPDSGSKG